MDKTMAAVIGVIIVAVVAILVFNVAGAGAGVVQDTQAAANARQPGSLDGASAGDSGGPGSIPAAGTGDTRTVTLSSRGNQYSPAEIRVKLGTKVRIEGDPTTLTGCMNTVDIDGYGISKRIRAGDNVIEFTADKAGTFPIHCNMGIGNGRLVVEDSTGNVPAQSQAPVAARGSGGCCG
jgi:plastocyanin